MERLVDVVTPLGEALWFRQMSGTEALSSLFEFDVTFHSKQSGLSAKAMLGKDVTLKVETEGGKGVRYLSGICTRFGSGGREGVHLLYTAKLRPWLWLASRRSDCKIFQFKKVPDIISEVLGKYGFELAVRLKRSYREWEYCVQYQETDLNFVMRLMEHEGIYFHFEHALGSHKLVLADDISCHSPLPGKPDIKYYGVAAAGVVDEEHFDSWQVLEEVNSGEYITDDYDFEKPRGDLKTKRKNPMGHSHDAWERYMWPGGYIQYGHGENYSGVRLESLEAEHERTEGNTTVRTMAPGYLFNLLRCPRVDQNREYLSVAVTYFFRDNARMSAGSGAGDATWHILVTSQPTTVPYRPSLVTPKPLSNGPQTAVVVGPAGEEIHTDKYGRVKVHFFWDRHHDKKDENSSCWIRVSHPWAGEKWGFIHIPRVGQEVIVDFIGGDPDYPMITGRVYNADQMPPYGLPGNKTASGIKSRSTKGGGEADFNEIRMEDSKGNEQLYIHAQRNLDTVVEADESRLVGHDRRTRIEHDDNRFVVHDDRHVINNNQSHQIGANQDTTVGSNQTVTVGAAQSVTVGASRSLSVGAAMSESVGANHNQQVGGQQAISVGGSQTVQIGSNQSVKVSGGRSTVVTGDDKNVFTGKASFSGPNYSVLAGQAYSETCTTREALVYGTDKTEVMLKQTETIGAAREVTVGAKDSLTVGGLKSTDVGAAYTIKAGAAIDVSAGLAMTLKSGAVVSISAAGAVSITGAAVTVTAGTITMMGVVTVLGTLTVAGPVIAASIVSPTYSPGVGNMI